MESKFVFLNGLPSESFKFYDDIFLCSIFFEILCQIDFDLYMKDIKGTINVLSSNPPTLGLACLIY